MVTQHGKPMFTKVCTEGRLILEFAFDDLMRIKTWHFTIRQYRELIPRSILAMHAQDPQVLEQLSKNITRMGLTNFTLNYLRLCVILEPMQELMSRHKTYNLSPRDCLKTCLFQKWQRMVAPQGISKSLSSVLQDTPNGSDLCSIRSLRMCVFDAVVFGEICSNSALQWDISGWTRTDLQTLQ
uniref:LIM domain binding 2a n=1 Tax=Cyprinus carpio carpio TaxID=630221 RepID=A0A8C1ENH8_CYPCA